MIDFSDVVHLKYIIDFETACDIDEDGNYDDSRLPLLFAALGLKLKEAFPHATFDVWADNSEYVSEPMLEFTLADGRDWLDHGDDIMDLWNEIEAQMQRVLIPAAQVEMK